MADFQDLGRLRRRQLHGVFASFPKAHPMFFSLTLAVFAAIGGTGGSSSVHTPHSVTSSVAFGERASGEMEMVIISRGDARVMSSIDDGFSFSPVAGDGLGKVNAHRVVFYEVPSTGEKRFLIATDAGVWKYVPATGLVQEISSGLDLVNTYYTDLSAPLPGQDGPVVTINMWGQVFRLDETTDTWAKTLDLGRFDENAVCSVVPNFDRAAAAGPSRSIAVGSRGILVTSDDGGTTWASHPQFNTPANDIYEFHITAIEFDRDYANTGIVMLGRGKRDDLATFESEGEMWRSNDFGASFTQLSFLGSTQFSSSVRAIRSAGTGPDLADHWFASVYRFPEHPDFDAGLDTIGVLHSTDGGLTWDDQDSYQEFIQEFSGNERTAVGLPYRRMMQITVSPDFDQDGELWLARSEGLYKSKDQGVTWEKRRFRPSTQVRGISSNYNHRGEIVTWGASYGSGLYYFNHTTGVADTLTGDGVIYYATVEASKNAALDGIVMGGGQRDLAVWFDEPNPANRQKWYSVNEIRALIDGDTGYVRTLALSPRFGGKGVPGAEAVFAWSARFEDSPFGETRMTLDGLKNVYLLNDVFNQPGQRAPYFHEMDIAQSFDRDNLPYEVDIFGATEAFGQVYRLLNTGTAGTPVFEWFAIDTTFEGTLIDVQADPRFDRSQGTATLWALSTSKLYRLDENSSDWSNFTVTEYDGIDDYLVVDMKLSPDMDLAPAVFAATWGNGVYKLDLTDPSPTWQHVGGTPPGVWGECISLSPDFENDRLIFMGTQRGLYYIEDRPGGQWVKVNNEVIFDSANTSFDVYSPADPTNPDPSRPWGWDILKTDVIPANILDKIDIFGESLLAGEFTGDYCEASFKAGSKISIMTFKGPLLGEVRITCWDADSGTASAPFHDVTVDLNQVQLQNFELEVPLPQAGNYTVRIEATNLPFKKYIFIDGVRLTD